mmetsp:Transcript_111213/g.295559  ORF Transcript_111213/g.295559 Transcript_111213/m.295559 type:complete len:314 (+) Transcript_111213:152-1093(+)
MRAERAAPTPPSEVLLQLRVLLRKLQQHGVVEELVHGHILAQTLAPAHLQHELAREVRRGRRLERAEQDGAVQGVPGDELPVVEHRLAHGLPRGVGAEVRLKAEGLHGRQVRVHHVHGATRLRQVAHHVPTAPGEHVVDGGHAVRGALNLRELNRLHEPGRGQEEGGVGHAPRGRDDLAAATHGTVLGERRVEDLELHAPDPLVAERTLLAGPLEALDKALLRLRQHALVHFAWQRVVHQHVGTIGLRAEGPDGPCSEQVPIVVLGEEVADSPIVPIDLHFALLDILADTLLKRLSNHVELVLLVGRLREALQ